MTARPRTMPWAMTGLAEGEGGDGDADEPAEVGKDTTMV